MNVIFYLSGLRGLKYTKILERTKNQESRVKNQEPRAKSQEPRIKNQEPRAKNQEPGFLPH
jgi:hypothetical protein